jgi:hypothetical protein
MSGVWQIISGLLSGRQYDAEARLAATILCRLASDKFLFNLRA